MADYHRNQQTKRKGGAFIVGPKDTILDMVNRINQCIELRDKSENIVIARKTLSELYKEKGSDQSMKNMKSNDRRLFLHRRGITPNVLEQSQFVRCYAMPIGQKPTADPEIVKEMEVREKKAIEGTTITVSTDKPAGLNLDRLLKNYTEFVEGDDKVNFPENYYYIYGLEPASPLYAYLVGYLGKTSEANRYVGAYALPRAVGATNEKPWDVMVRNIREELRLDLGVIGTIAYQKYHQRVDRVPRRGIFNLIALPPKDHLVITLDEKENLIKLSLQPDDLFHEEVQKQQAENESNPKYSNYQRRGGYSNYNNRNEGGNYNRGYNRRDNRDNNRGDYQNRRRGGQNRGDRKSVV